MVTERRRQWRGPTRRRRRSSGGEGPAAAAAQRRLICWWSGAEHASTSWSTRQRRWRRQRLIAGVVRTSPIRAVSERQRMTAEHRRRRHHKPPAAAAAAAGWRSQRLHSNATEAGDRRRRHRRLRVRNEVAAKWSDGVATCSRPTSNRRRCCRTSSPVHGRGQRAGTETDRNEARRQNEATHNARNRSD